MLKPILEVFKKLYLLSCGVVFTEYVFVASSKVLVTSKGELVLGNEETRLSACLYFLVLIGHDSVWKQN